MNRYLQKSKVLWISKTLCIGRVLKLKTPNNTSNDPDPLLETLNKNSRMWPKVVTIKGIHPNGQIIVQSPKRKTPQFMLLPVLERYYE